MDPAGLSTFQLPGFIRLDRLEYALDMRVLGFAVGLSAISAVALDWDRPAPPAASTSSGR